jgi:hypothetical protein
MVTFRRDEIRWGMAGSTDCPRCGAALPPPSEPRRGRRRVWCSDACRRAAHIERVGAERAGTAVRVVEIPRISPAVRVPMLVPRDLTRDELVHQMLGDSLAVQILLKVLTAQAREKKLDRKVREECYELARVLLPNASRY